MINLIPSEAKKHLLREYWVRTVTVWFFLWASALFLGVVLLAPSYVLINLQVKAYAETAETANAKNENFEAIAKELERSSKTAVALSENFSGTALSDYLALLKSFESRAVEVTKISLSREGEGIAPIALTGIAADRQALAAFRNRMLEHEEIESVDLPISNLAKDKEIPFELTITLAKEQTP